MLMQEVAASPRAVGYPLQPIAESGLFKGLDRDCWTTLLSLHGPQRRAERDALLVRPRDKQPPLITLSRGWAFRYSLLPDGRRQILSFALPGDTIGLGNVLTGAPAYPVQAAGTVMYSIVPHERVQELLSEASWFRAHAVDALAEERAEAEILLTRLGQCNAEERVASVLLEFYNRLSARGLASDNTFVLDLTQQQLADYLGLTVVHMNRMLGRLRGRKLIQMSGHRLTFLDVPAMERLVVVARARE